ncbi:CoA-acylating methylmalonate-semialdehyde dehydrogenase [Aureispira anguillae]|uniref:CoA-acylating methylmalonate-semialdehyde dehydrogenase n=1 Tax=Aureispira anguillae TaxID=2864201 RepID=A0A916DX40_9BACT|nr:CoA-acylating methylmalonate-semialdehyde dehydrogenase [Aureispira anguillae]BDS15370.1 CoA-acylating methylmalonate-semialdehyde dehydrogenase [Aureispira anguillae]
MLETKNYIAGTYVDDSYEKINVVSPIDGTILSTMPMSDAAAVNQAVEVAKKAFTSWSKKTLKERVQVFFRFRNLLEQHRDELIALVHQENGKTKGEAAAEVDKGIELCEFACSLPQIVNDEVQEVSKGVECRTTHVPMGVVASITPFNFPHMVPLWSVPNALALGNCMILKPSELVPLSAIRIGELLTEAGLPEGVYNVVNGGKAVVEAICDHPDIKAVSFVGSTKVAKIVYQRATSNLKRCAALGGAKNHLIVLDDAHVDMAASNIAASMSGCAGQRCMAASAMVAVGQVDHIIARLCEEAQKIICGENLGAVISAEAKARIEGYITAAEAAGAEILVDGRNTVVAGKEGGFYVAPTIIDKVTPDMAIAKEEVFGPVLAIMRTDTIDEALEIENASNYGNAAAVFTQSGGLARYIMDRVSAGMVGVNVGVPVPREPFSFGGWNDSRFGSHDITGRSSIAFWTYLKKTTTKWNPEAKTNWMS